MLCLFYFLKLATVYVSKISRADLPTWQDTATLGLPGTGNIGSSTEFPCRTFTILNPSKHLILGIMAFDDVERCFVFPSTEEEQEEEESNLSSPWDDVDL